MSKKKVDSFDLENDRFGLFLNDSSFDLDVDLGREYLKSDVKYIVKIHKINVIESKSHKLYGQAKPADKKFFPPVKLNALVEIGDSEQKNYTDGGAVRDDISSIIVKVYLKELKEKNIEIDRGDIIEYNMSGERARYFEVENAQNVTDVTSQTIANMRPYWKRITGVPIKEDVVPFLNETK